MKKKPKKTELEKRLERELLESGAAVGDEPVDADVPEAEVLPAEIEALVSERDALADQLLRARAEFDNYRKRVARDAEWNRKRAAEALICDLLPVLDHLELALDHAGDWQAALGKEGGDASASLAQGVDMVIRQFRDVFRQHGVEPIAAVGEPFDPHRHEAVLRLESAEVPENIVVQEYQKGYLLGDVVLRPAKVVVSGGAPDARDEDPAPEPQG